MLIGARNSATRPAEPESTSPSLPIVFLSNHGTPLDLHRHTLASVIFSTTIHALEGKVVIHNSRSERISNWNAHQALVNLGNFFHMTLKVPDHLIGGHLNAGFWINAEWRNATEQRQLKDHVHNACRSSEGKHVNQQLFMLAPL